MLPWRACGSRSPWVGARHDEKTEHAVDELLVRLRAAPSLVWGGDWNHALSGREYAGSIGGRAAVLAAVAELDLEVPTADLQHAIDEVLSIDHLALPRGRGGVATRIVAAYDGKRLSDHDVYVVEAEIGPVLNVM